MSIELSDTSVYFGDIHGTRLEHLSTALDRLGICASGLLCTMDLDQVLSIQDLLTMQRNYESAGKQSVLVPGNHEAAIIHRIGIDSSTYRKKHQDTNILALIEALNLPNFRPLRAAIESILEVVGGRTIQLDEHDTWRGLLIHGALAGKEEKYIAEFPPELQEHVRTRTDLWLRLEFAEHIRANFEAMRSGGWRFMLRGHDHYLAMRSLNERDELCSHQLVVNVVGEGALDYRAEAPRADDTPDDMVLVDSSKLAQAQEQGTLYWHELEADSMHVINCGPYYQGHFGLIRAATDDQPPAVAFCSTEVSVYNEEDRKTRLLPMLSANQARAGKTFYELFPRDD